MGTYEVTQGQWESVMGTEPWKGQPNVQEGNDYPAVYVSWWDMQAFIGKLNALDSSSIYRLPTEAEWEYACRAGSTTAYSFGDDASELSDYAWYRENASDVDEKYAHQVGGKKPNDWDLYDMHGNVWERVEDQWDDSGSNRVLRSSGFYGTAEYARSAYRLSIAIDGSRGPDLGFRLLRMAL